MKKSGAYSWWTGYAVLAICPLLIVAFILWTLAAFVVDVCRGNVSAWL